MARTRAMRRARTIRCRRRLAVSDQILYRAQALRRASSRTVERVVEGFSAIEALPPRLAQNLDRLR
ncbi:hypothetical protein WH5701_09264 [Synechococcus sp. WH 5701]|nr:hypothetical protein WH5701_09264 [Synechococcus sp. WH 5701]